MSIFLLENSFINKIINKIMLLNKLFIAGNCLIITKYLVHSYIINDKKIEKCF